MKDYEPVMSFDEDTAATYDDFLRGDEAETVAFLRQLARGGPALELAVGTGRIALPLAESGVRVDGIDLSEAMLAKLRAKPGGDQLQVVLGNFADVGVPGQYPLIYIVFNTIFNLLTQDEQVRCFENVAPRLTPDGVFVVEGIVPAEFYRLRNNQYVDAEGIETGYLRLDVARFDPVSQVLDETHVMLSAAGIRLSPIVTRLTWPSELDLMARIAGLRLRERWGSWKREAYLGDRGNCISVYERSG